MKKQMISAVALACLMTTQTLPAYGAPVEAAPAREDTASQTAEPAKDGLSTAIEKAKVTLAIDSAIWDIFSYDSYDSGDGQRWSLNWRQSGDSDQHLSATIDENGVIRSYDYYRPMNVSGLAAIRQAQAAQTADQFAARVAPGYIASLNRLPETAAYQGGDSFTFVYQQQHDGVPVADGTVEVRVNRYTGTVTSFTVNDAVNCADQGWPDKNKAITAAAAEKALLSEIGVELVYLSRYDYDTETYSVYPAYRPAQYDKVLDAVTGKAVTLKQSALAAYSKDAAAEGSNRNAGGLSPQELAAVKANAQLITQEDAVSRLRQATGAGADLAVQNASLTTAAYEKSRYIWHIYLQSEDQRSVSGTLDAQTGQLLSFSRYDRQAERLAQPQSKAQADQAVAAFLKQYAPSELAASRAVDQEERSEDTVYSYPYQRLANGISFPDNGLSVVYDAETGRITSYQLNWNKSVTFPSIEKVKQPAVIVQDMIKQADFSLQYAREDKGYRLIYAFADRSAMRFDPFDGQRLDWRGKPYTAQALPIYHWQGASSESAQRLYENGIYLDKNELNVQSAITQGELAQLLYRSRYPYAEVTDMDQVYADLNRLGLILQKEAAPNAAVTRQQAAQYAIRLLGYERLTAYGDLFIYPYQDKTDSAYQASVAISGALGLLQADNTNTIRPTADLTQGDAFDLVYKALSK